MTDLEEEFERIAEREPVVRAWVARVDDDHLRAALADRPEGPLHGWTLGVKDVIDTVDLPTERGSPIYAGRRTMNDAACVALARRAGALVTGKTTTTEFALFTPTVTTNPHQRDRTPGGSSSGSAAAVAAGMVRVAFGTQTVGSVIRPAAFCGVVGFKGTHQLVPMAGVASLAQSLDTLGWFARSVDDATSVYRALTNDRALVAGRSPSGGGRPRIGVYRSHQWGSAEPGLAAVLDEAADRLAEQGAEVTQIEPLPHLDGLFEAADVILLFETARVLDWERHQHGDLISPLVRKMLERSNDITPADYGEAQRLVNRARQIHGTFLVDAGLDALLTPSAPGEAPPMKTTGDSVFNREWTTLGVPTINLPTGRGPRGLPVGVQLTGQRWGDADLLGVAGWAEAALTPQP